MIQVTDMMHGDQFKGFLFDFVCWFYTFLLAGEASEHNFWEVTAPDESDLSPLTTNVF